LRPRLILAALATLVGAAGVALFAAGGGGAGPAPAPALARLPPIALAKWEPRAGDVVLTATRDILDGQIRHAAGDGARFSHSGLVVPHDGRLLIVEATPFGSGSVAFREIADFTTEGALTELLVMRPRPPPDTGRLAAEASRLVAARIPFDYDLDADDPSRLYCTELVTDLLRFAGEDVARLERVPMSMVLNGTRMIIAPDAFARAPGFAPVFRRDVS
jgi:Permuted papain-like amidase enzyme, YaeF/YiiX, C92 family